VTSALPIGFNNATVVGVASDDSNSEKAKKVKKLNESFLKWASKQIETHPLSIWKEGVKDYIKHYKGIEEKYGAETSSSTVSEQPAAVAPAVTAPPAVSFAAPSATKSSPFADFSFGAKPAAAVPVVAAKPAAAPAAAASPFSNFAFPAAPPAVAPAAKPAAPLPTPAAFTGFGGAASAAAPAKLGDFKFGAAPAAPAAGGFGSTISFGAPAPAAAANKDSATASFLNSFASTAPPAFGGFGAPAVAGGTTVTPALTGGPFGSGAGEEDGEGGDDEGEPILEPEKVLRNSNDTDEILHEVPCKLYGYSTADKEWKDTGKGTFRITRDAKTQKQRMLVRNQIGRINFNAAFFAGMKVEQVQKKIKFAAFVTVEDTTMGADGKAAPPRTEMKNFMIQLKAEDVDATLKKMQSGIASV